MSVGFSQLAGGWQINGRGTIYTTKVLAEAAEKKGAAPNITYGSDAEFKQAMKTVVVLQPKLTPEMEAKLELDALKATLANNPNKARKALCDTQIAALLAKWPNLKRDELALQAKAAKATADAKAKADAAFAKDRAASNAQALAESNASALWSQQHNPAGSDWTPFVAFGAVLAAGAAIIVSGGAAAGALAGGLTVTSAATAVASTVAVVKGVSELVKGEVPSLAVPGLAQAGIEALAGTQAAADVLLAANELGGAAADRAREIVEATRTLAAAGNVDAVKAVSVLVGVAKERVDQGVPAGVVRPLTPAGVAAVEAFALQDTIAAPPAMPAPPADATRGQFIHTDGALSGRLNFSSTAWRPVSATTPGALRGLVVSDLGRIAFAEDWIPA